MPNINWDAKDYKKDFSFVPAYGEAVMDLITKEQCFAERGFRYQRVFYFPTIGQYAPLLEKAGFKIEYAVLFGRPTPQKGPDGLE